MTNPVPDSIPSPDTVIRLDRVSKNYPCRLSGRQSASNFQALKNINLTIRRGDQVGITGKNGSGKSTLLKIIAGITSPSSGTVHTSGKIVSLMKLESGFNLELTGRENIYINGLLVGMSKNEIDAKSGRIIEFTGISQFIDMPLYTYSDGMKFRLALSIALFAKCDILLIDELLVSGDIDFQKRSLSALRRAQKSQQLTTVITSHIPSFIWSFSRDFYQLDHGTLHHMSAKEMETETFKIDSQWRKLMFNTD